MTNFDSSSHRKHCRRFVDDDTTHLVEYEYLGQGSFVVAGNPQPDLQWTLASLTGTDDPDTGDIYAGLDRFGRIKDCRWYNTGTSSDAVRLKYGYDRASNRIWRQDDVARSLSKGFDELYAYDGLQRLKTMQRGLLNGSHDAISSPTYGQCWNLDATENWTGMKQAEGGASWTLEQARTANPVNEITSITNAVGPTWAEPAYDPAGNMTAIPQSADPETSFTATWDAWNRLVKLLDDDTAETIAEYLYDVTNRRILKKLYASGVLDQTRHIYLSSSNQVLEERVDAATAASMQNVWGLMYIDGLVLRDRDTDGNGILDERRYCLQDGNWNAVVLVDTSGDVTQRFCYQPFGTCEFLEATYSPGTNEAEWVTLFTGRELDRESGLYYFRARYLSSDIGIFTGRDLLQYFSGRNLYFTYFIPSNLDPTGMAPIIPVCGCAAAAASRVGSELIQSQQPAGDEPASGTKHRDKECNCKIQLKLICRTMPSDPTGIFLHCFIAALNTETWTYSEAVSGMRDDVKDSVTYNRTVYSVIAGVPDWDLTEITPDGSDGEQWHKEYFFRPAVGPGLRYKDNCDWIKCASDYAREISGQFGYNQYYDNSNTFITRVIRHCGGSVFFPVYAIGSTSLRGSSH
ncbi:RHS repeat domain-containing protein [Planctomicrobium sp. SH527]|uniref:RHS repeat domain-containing protein n=1 Tax=Planctomicrobium sp. SH527 TaxID=3448123 RepID=UPI003F5B78AD